MDLTAICFLFIIFFILAFLADRLPFIKTARSISAYSKNSLQTIQSTDMDDSAKQGLLLKNSLGIFIDSIKIIAFTAILIGLLLGSLKASSMIKPLNYNYLMDFLVSLTGIILSLISFLSYFLLKKVYGRLRV